MTRCISATAYHIYILVFWHIWSQEKHTWLGYAFEKHYWYACEEIWSHYLLPKPNMDYRNKKHVIPSVTEYLLLCVSTQLVQRDLIWDNMFLSFFLSLRYSGHASPLLADHPDEYIWPCDRMGVGDVSLTVILLGEVVQPWAPSVTKSQSIPIPSCSFPSFYSVPSYTSHFAPMDISHHCFPEANCYSRQVYLGQPAGMFTTYS